MNARRTFATQGRILRQLRHDPRTVALLMLVPSILLGLLSWILHNSPGTFDHFAPSMLGIFPLIVMFLVTSVATLRERTGGTLERLLTMPLAKVEFVLGYALAFGTLAIAQAALGSGLSIGVYGLHVDGSPWLIVLVAVLNAVLGTALGLSLSALAATEFQAVQFMPAFIFPQLLLCGIIMPRDELPTPLHWLSDVLPMSYAVDATTRVATSSTISAAFVTDIIVVIGFVVIALVVGASTLRRRTP